MANLIDKDALVAEIEKRKNMFYDMSKGCEDASSAKAGFYAQAQTLEGILSFLNSLEVKEVDLEKEIEQYVSGKGLRDYGFLIPSIAKHFFKLGLQARTDKELVKEVYSHIDSIKDTADRMTSGNFMHNRAAIKFSANTIAKVLELIGLKAQKGE